MKLNLIAYSDLNARQKENFNFQKISAVLADYGFVTQRLSDDWNGADFIALHADGNTVLRVQLKSRLSFNKKYQGKTLYIAFAEAEEWYLYPHDELLDHVLADTSIAETESWKVRGGYSFPRIPNGLRKLLEGYRIIGTTKPIPE